MKRYNVRAPGRGWDDPGPDLLRTKDGAITKVLDTLEGADPPYSIRTRDPESGQWRDWREVGGRPALIDELMASMPAYGQVGSGEVPKVVLRSRAVPDFTSSTATDACEVVISLLRAQFPEHNSLGWYNCRKVSGSSTWSTHAWGASYDAGGSETLVGRMGDWMVRMAQDHAAPVSEVIAVRRYWSPTTGYKPYTGADPHTGHIHVTSAPKPTGTPPCA